MENFDNLAGPDLKQVAPRENSPVSYSTEHAALGIQRVLCEVFVVGPFRYTSLADAVAQAHRIGL